MFIIISKAPPCLRCETGNKLACMTPVAMSQREQRRQTKSGFLITSLFFASSLIYRRTDVQTYQEIPPCQFDP